MAKKKKKHYVNNKDFLEAMIVYRAAVKEAEANNEPHPKVSEYIGSCILEIAKRLSYKPNFINYPFVEDMVADGIENCLLYIDNFDPEKSKNPFSYFTQIIYYAFLRRIHKEKKHLYIRYKSIDDYRIHNDDPNSKTVLERYGTDDYNTHMQEYIETFEGTRAAKKKSKKKKEAAPKDDVTLEALCKGE